MREWLVALRNEQGLAAQDVAKALSITPAYYSLIESGKRQKKMDITLVFAIAKLFGVSVEHVIELENSSIGQGGE